MSADSHTRGSDTVAEGVTDDILRRLRVGNLALTVLHLGQAFVVLLLASDFAIAVTETFPQGPPGSDPKSVLAWQIFAGSLQGS